MNETKTLTAAEQAAYDRDHAVTWTDQSPTLTAAEKAAWDHDHEVGDQVPTPTTAPADNARSATFTNYLNPVVTAKQGAANAVTLAEQIKADDEACTATARQWVAAKRDSEFEAEVAKAKVICLRDRKLKAEKAAKFAAREEADKNAAREKAFKEAHKAETDRAAAAEKSFKEAHKTEVHKVGQVSQAQADAAKAKADAAKADAHKGGK